MESILAGQNRRPAIARLVAKPAPATGEESTRPESVSPVRDKLLGTAFAVSRDLAVTAFHCVGDRRRGILHSTLVQLLFAGGQRIDVDVRPGSAEADFVLLALRQPLPDDLDPLALSANVMVDTPWTATGFPVAVRGTEHTTVGGKVRDPHGRLRGGIPALELFCDEAAAGRPLPLGGLSGAPVVAVPSGEVLGLVRWNPTAPEAPDLALGGQVFACPAGMLVDQVPALAPVHKLSSGQQAMLSGVPDLPPHFVARDEELGIVIEAVLRGSGPPIGLFGMGGAGKSVIARAVAHELARPDTGDPSVAQAVPDVVVWLDLRGVDGHSADEAELLRLQGTLARALGPGGVDTTFRDTDEGNVALRRLLDGRRCLLILDDVRRIEAVQPFLRLGNDCRLLLTTRDQGLLRMLDAIMCPVGVLSDELARALLSRWAGWASQDLPPEALEVAAECGGLPLALAMAGAMVRRRSWDDVLARLQGADLERIRAKFVDYPQHHTLLRAIEAGTLELADDPECPVDNPLERYVDLAVFREAGAFPEAAAQTLWGEAGVDPVDAVDLIVVLLDRSLLQRDALGRLRLHDLQYDYTTTTAGPRIGELHARLVDGYSHQCSNGWATGPNDGYFHDHLAQHLNTAGRLEEIRALLTDFDWLYVRISQQDLARLLGDFRFIDSDEAAHEVENVLRGAADVISADASEVAGQLVGRLQAEASPAIRQLVGQIRGWRARTWLCPTSASLLPPRHLRVRRLPSLGRSGTAGVVSRDGLVAATASTSALALWHPLDSSSPEMVNVSDRSSVSALALTADGGLLAVACFGGYLGVFRTSDGNELEATRVGDENPRSLAITPDGTQLVYGTDDGALGIWDRSTGVQIRTGEAHPGDWAYVLVPNRDLVISWPGFGQVALWKLRDGRLTLVLRQAVDGLPPIAVTPNGSMAVLYTHEDLDPVEVIWDLQGMQVVRRPITFRPMGALLVTNDGLVVNGHAGGLSVRSLVDRESPSSKRRTASDETVRDVRLVPQSIAAISEAPRRIVSASADGTLYLWDMTSTGNDPRQLGVHGTGVPSLAISADARNAVSISWDGTIAVWDLSDATLPSESEGNRFTAIAVSSDGQRAVVGSVHRQVELVGSEMSRPAPVGEHFTLNLALTPDGRRAVSGGSDGEVRVWDLPIHSGDQGRLRMELKPPSQTSTDRLVRAIAVTPDGGQALWGLQNGTVIWSDIRPGAQPVSKRPHGDAVESVALDARGRYGVSGSRDGTVALWYLGSQLEPRIVERFARRASAVAITAGGERILTACERQAGSRGPGLSLIDIASGEIRRGAIDDFILELAIDEGAEIAVGASYEGSVVVWDLISFRPMARFHGDAPIRFCCFGPGDRQIIAADLSGVIHRLQLIS